MFVTKIRSEVGHCKVDPVISIMCPAIFFHFEPVSMDTLHEIVGRMKPTNYPLDSTPAWLFKRVFDIIGPF